MAALYNESSIYDALFYRQLMKIKYRVSKAFPNAPHVNYNTLAGLVPQSQLRLEIDMCSQPCHDRAVLPSTTQQQFQLCLIVRVDMLLLFETFSCPTRPLLGALFLVYKMSFPSQPVHTSPAILPPRHPSLKHPPHHNGL